MTLRRIATALAALAMPLLLATASPSGATTRPIPATTQAVVEHYHGKTFVLTPTNWHGAKDCAIVARTSAYCFDNADQMNAFTETPEAYPALAGGLQPLVSCSGYTKIWNGTNWTGTGLAFNDWGYWQNLNSYTTVPFKVISWFSDGQRSYAPNNCNGHLNNGNGGGGGSTIALPECAHALNMGTAFNAYSIKLDSPTGSC
jgi:hypothetical protein